LTVSANGPVTVIYSLPSPKQKPFPGDLELDSGKDVGIQYELGGGLLGRLYEIEVTLW